MSSETRLPRKIRPTEMRTFLSSPRRFYWEHVRGLKPLMPSVDRFEHHREFGVVWAAFVDRFYRGLDFKTNLSVAKENWWTSADGWVPGKIQASLAQALENLATDYYQQFRPDDGARIESEKALEGEVLWCTPDGIGEGRIVHEVKTCSRPKSQDSLLWRIRNSIQVKTQCVLAKANGVRIELAFKDPPGRQVSYRSGVVPVTKEQRDRWQGELESLAEYILSLDGNPHYYPCSPDGCSIITKSYTSECPYRILCDGQLEVIPYLFKERKTHGAG